MPPSMIERLRPRARGGPRLLRALSGLAVAGVAVALAVPAAAAPVGVPVATPGTVTAWGGDPSGQVRDAPAAGGVTAIAAGRDHSLALTADGHITAWGLDSAGQVGGTPTTAGTSIFTITASNGVAPHAVLDVTLTVSADTTPATSSGSSGSSGSLGSLGSVTS